MFDTLYSVCTHKRLLKYVATVHMQFKEMVAVSGCQRVPLKISLGVDMLHTLRALCKVHVLLLQHNDAWALLEYQSGNNMALHNKPLITESCHQININASFHKVVRRHPIESRTLQLAQVLTGYMRIVRNDVFMNNTHIKKVNNRGKILGGSAN